MTTSVNHAGTDLDIPYPYFVDSPFHGIGTVRNRPTHHVQGVVGPAVILPSRIENDDDEDKYNDFVVEGEEVKVTGEIVVRPPVTHVDGRRWL